MGCKLLVYQWRSSELVMYMAWCIFILQNKSIVYIFLLINSCMKFVSWIFFFSCTIFWHPTSICPTGFCFLFCIIVPNVGKNWIFWSIQSVMGFGICGHRFRRSPFTNKIFYIYKSACVCVRPARVLAGAAGRPRAQPSPPDVWYDRLGSLSFQITRLHASS